MPWCPLPLPKGKKGNWLWCVCVGAHGNALARALALALAHPCPKMSVGNNFRPEPIESPGGLLGRPYSPERAHRGVSCLQTEALWKTRLHALQTIG